MNKLFRLLAGLALLSLLLSACQAPTPVVEKVVETVVVTELVEGETVEKIITATPEPETQEPVTLRWMRVEDAREAINVANAKSYRSLRTKISLYYSGEDRKALCWFSGFAHCSYPGK